MKSVREGLRSSLIRRKILLATSMLALAAAHGQVIEEWRVLLPTPTNIAVDTSGNVYVVGNVTVEGGQTHAFLRKYSTQGNILWEQSIVQGPYSTGAACAGIDGSGNVYVFGAAGALGALGGYGTEGYLQKAFVQKYTPIGGLAWTKSYGGESTICDPRRSFVDTEGNVLIACIEEVDMYDCKDTVRGRGGNNGCYGVILRYDTYGLGTEIKYYGRGNDRVSQCAQLFRDPTGAVYSQWALSSYCSGAPGEYYTGDAMVKHGLTGGVLWQQIRGGLETPYESLAGVDREGNRYTLIGEGLDYHLRKYSPMNVLLWDAHHGISGIGVVREDDEGNIFALSWRGDFVKYDSQGQEIWRSSGASDQDQLILFDRFGLIHTGAACFDASGKALYCAFTNLYQPSSGMHFFGADARGCEYVLRRDYDQYYMCKFLYGRILSPQKGDLWISGEQDTIRWGASLGDASFDIEYSKDDGVTYELVASGISADSLQYVWDIPAETSAKAKTKVKLHNKAKNITYVVSDRFGVKPYIITRKEAGTGDMIGYNPASDTWGFGNFQDDMWPSWWYNQFDYNSGIDPFLNQPYSQIQGGGAFLLAQPSDFTDWISFVDAFGQDACYSKKGLYKPMALLHWQAKKGEWNGSCFGIAVSNGLAFEDSAGFHNRYREFPSFATPNSVISSGAVIKSISALFAQQYGNPNQEYRTKNWSKTPNQTLKDLKEMMKTENTKTRRLALFNNSGGGGHAVLPYKIEKSPTYNDVWHVYVYDNSVPTDLSAFVSIDTSVNNKNGSWSYYNLSGWGGNGGILVGPENSTFLGTATLPKRSIQQSPFILPDTTLEVLATHHADIQIRDRDGRTTGYADSALRAEIPSSVPLIVENGRRTPPYGYHLRSGGYSVLMDHFTSDTVDACVFTGNTAFTYRRSGAKGSETDRLCFDGGLSVANPDPATKTVRLLHLRDEPADARLAIISSLPVAQGDSVKLDTLASPLRLMSRGSAKSYSLELQHVSDTSLSRFVHASIPLAANTTHRIEPYWQNLRDSVVRILVDIGNDGTVDQTIELTNDLTGTEEHGSLIPGEYQLYQNYPNPFNPMTTIRYGLPRKSEVHLTVYNLLGQEVSTLVNMEEEAGYHEVRFDGSNLASGVYIYRLEAGDFVQSRKLILLR